MFSSQRSVLRSYCEKLKARIVRGGGVVTRAPRRCGEIKTSGVYRTVFTEQGKLEWTSCQSVFARIQAIFERLHHCQKTKERWYDIFSHQAGLYRGSETLYAYSFQGYHPGIIMTNFAPTRYCSESSMVPAYSTPPSTTYPPRPLPALMKALSYRDFSHSHSLEPSNPSRTLHLYRRRHRCSCRTRPTLQQA